MHLDNKNSNINNLLKKRSYDLLELSFTKKESLAEINFSCERGGQYEDASIKLICENCVLISGLTRFSTSGGFEVKISSDFPEQFKGQLDEGYLTTKIISGTEHILTLVCLEIDVE